MKPQNEDLIVLFAILWGKHMASLPKSDPDVEIMKHYTSEELLDIFKRWTYDYTTQNTIQDSCDFFLVKLAEFLPAQKQ